MNTPLQILAWAIGIFLALPILALCLLSTWELYRDALSDLREWWGSR